MAKRPQQPKNDRIAVLQLAWSPLRFFVLVLLVIESTFIFIGYGSGQDKFILFLLNVVAIGAVAIMVGFLAYLGVFDEANQGQKLPSYKVFIEQSKELQVDLGNIIWDEKNCRMWIGKSEGIQFTPAYPD